MGSPQPRVDRVQIDIKDPDQQGAYITAWEKGTYDLVGYSGDNQLPVADLLRIKSSRSERNQLLIEPMGRTTWVSFNVVDRPLVSPFVGESATAVGLRRAFALAVDKGALAATVCHNLACSAATGGIISRGLPGYGGDGSDALAAYDPHGARVLLDEYDARRVLTANLTYGYVWNGDLNKAVAGFLQQQWRDNLGVSLNLYALPDVGAFIAERLPVDYVMHADCWQADNSHPRDWYRNLWGAHATVVNNGQCSTPAQQTPSTYDNSTYDADVAVADDAPVERALPLYAQAAQILQHDAVYIPLFYATRQLLVHPYVHGAGANALADYYWDEITLLAH